MKFDCGQTWEEKKAAREEWHLWYAWYPVRTGSHDCRWMEWVERKGKAELGIDGVSWNYKYRAIDNG